MEKAKKKMKLATVKEEGSMFSLVVLSKGSDNRTKVCMTVNV